MFNWSASGLENTGQKLAETGPVPFCSSFHGCKTVHVQSGRRLLLRPHNKAVGDKGEWGGIVYISTGEGDISCRTPLQPLPPREQAIIVGMPP